MSNKSPMKTSKFLLKHYVILSDSQNIFQNCNKSSPQTKLKIITMMMAQAGDDVYGKWFRENLQINSQNGNDRPWASRKATVPRNNSKT